MAQGVSPTALHGEKVGMNEILLLDIYKKTDLDALFAGPIRWRDMEADIRLAYGDVAEKILQENTPDCSRNLRPELIEKNLEEVKKIYAGLPDGQELKKLMAGIGCTTEPEQLSCDAAMMEYCLQYACYVRNRLTLMRLKRQIL